MIAIAVAVAPWLVVVPLLWANLRPFEPGDTAQPGPQAMAPDQRHG